MALLKDEPLEEVSRVTRQPAHILKKMGGGEMFLQGGDGNAQQGREEWNRETKMAS